MEINNKKSRSEEITENYFKFLDQHIADVISGKTTDFLEINQIASELFISHQHLTDTIQQATNHHPCYFYDYKIIEKVKELLLENEKSVAEIAKKRIKFSIFTKKPKSSPYYIFFSLLFLF